MQENYASESAHQEEIIKNSPKISIQLCMPITYLRLYRYHLEETVCVKSALILTLSPLTILFNLTLRTKEIFMEIKLKHVKYDSYPQPC